jgi:hypothetical protein
MEVVQKRIRYASRTDVFSLWFLGDLHVGAASCDERAIRDTVKQIRADPLALWFGLGDLAEFIPRQDFRFRQSRLAPWLRGLDADYCDDLIDQQLRWIVTELTPIADKCVGMLYGNHEDKHLAKWERDVHRHVCREMKVENLTNEALVRLVFFRGRASDARKLDVYVHHGWFAGRKSGAKVNNLHDLFASWDVDIAAVGHGHDRMIAPPFTTLYLNAANELAKRRRYALMTGSYLKTHEQGVTCYASDKGYRSTDMGAVRLLFGPNHNELHGEI